MLLVRKNNLQKIQVVVSWPRSLNISQPLTSGWIALFPLPRGYGCSMGRVRGERKMWWWVTHLLPSGYPGWPSCPTASYWLLPRLNPTSLVSPSLHAADAQVEEDKKERGKKKKRKVSEDKLLPWGQRAHSASIKGTVYFSSCCKSGYDMYR